MEGSSARQFTNICVFCGSNPGEHEEFVNTANLLGGTLAERKLHLVYGGGSLGLMGVVSTAAFVSGSQVLGIIPRALQNLTGKTLGEELIVSTMQERLAKMLDHSDAFIALPGGYGTLEEIFQIASWAQLNIHKKPIGLLNVNNFFDGLLTFLDHAVEQKFITPLAREIIISASTPGDLIDKLQNFIPKTDPEMAQVEWSEGSSKKRKVDLTLSL